MATYRIVKDCLVGDTANGNGYVYTAGELVEPAAYEEMVALDSLLDFGLATVESA